jgi:hypothetical protein
MMTLEQWMRDWDYKTCRDNMKTWKYTDKLIKYHNRLNRKIDSHTTVDVWHMVDKLRHNG